MRPGVVELPDGIEKGDIVAIVDVKNRKPLCVAQALYKGEEIGGMGSGKAFKTLHWVGDRYWGL